MRLAAVIALLALIWPGETAAQVRDVRVKWRTVRSEHFEVHYAEGLEKLAERALAVLE
ncbi:MAG: hypothetical protein R3A47_06970 [Polyangiales bacterium]